jgi:HD-like signal output (HDOD) protein
VSLAIQLDGQHPSTEVLRRLSTLRELNKQQLELLSSQLVIQTASRGAKLLSRGSNDATTLYLLHGRLRLTAADGATTRLSHEDRSASNPVARLRPSRYDVIAETAVRYVSIDSNLLQGDIDRDAGLNSVENYEVHEENDLDEIGGANKMSMRLWQELNSERLLLPSLPDVAIRVGRAVSDEDSDSRKVAELVSADPAISAKLLKVANSARYGGAQPVRTVLDAVVRLGLATTHHLVISFALRELFRSGSAVLQKRMAELWSHSRRVAAISQILARKLRKFDPEFALLAGLIHDIGAVVVVSYARDFPELSDDPQSLEAIVGQLRGQVGKMLISRWQLPSELGEVAQDAENWQRDPESPQDYTDLIIIAQLHSFVGTPQQAGAPAIDKVPAHRRLGLGDLTPEASLILLEEAKEEIRHSEQMLGS